MNIKEAQLTLWRLATGIQSTGIQSSINVATGIQSSIKHSRNRFFNFLPQIDINSFFINPANKTEIKNIILSLDPLKSILLL